jgi:hypothetical protein
MNMITSMFHEGWEICSLTEQLWALKEGFCSIDLLELQEISAPIFVVQRCDDCNFRTFG